jgi:hypothetical protein
MEGTGGDPRVSRPFYKQQEIPQQGSGWGVGDVSAHIFAGDIVDPSQLAGRNPVKTLKEGDTVRGVVCSIQHTRVPPHEAETLEGLKPFPLT